MDKVQRNSIDHKQNGLKYSKNYKSTYSRKAVNKMKSGKAPGLDEFSVECLKKGGMAS